MLSLRNRLGIRTPAHALANMLMPVVASSTRSLHVLRMSPWLKSRLAHECVILETPVLLVAAGESRDKHWLEHGVQVSYRDGESATAWQVLLDVERMSAARCAPAGIVFDRFPGHNDPREWVEWTRHCLEGKLPLPPRIANELACCLYGCGYAGSIHQAKAIAAVEPGGNLAAA
jgi:anthranilate phosphoribosyltransferase